MGRFVEKKGINLFYEIADCIDENNGIFLCVCPEKIKYGHIISMDEWMSP